MHLSPEIKHFQRRKTGLPILRKQLKSFFLQFPKKKSGGVDTAQTIKASFLSLKTSKNRWNLGFQPVHMRDHRNRGGRFCNNNSTSIHTRFRHKIDKIMKTHAGPCESMWLHMRDHKDRGGRFCNYNSTSIHTRFRHKIDKIMKRFSSYTYIHTRFPYGILNKTRFDRFSAVSTNFAILQILRNTGRPPAYNGIETFSIRAKINLFRKSQNRRPQPALPRNITEPLSRAKNPSRARAREKNKNTH